MMLGRIFSRSFRRDSVSRLSRARRDRRRATLSTLEGLEDRRLLAFQYQGFTHTAVPTIPTTQCYEYNLEIFDDPADPTDTMTMYMRHLSIVQQLQFDYNTSFSALTNVGSGISGSPSNFGSPVGFNWGIQVPPQTNPAGNPNPNSAFNIVGPLSLTSHPDFTNSPGVSANWNTRDTTNETFYLAKVRITCAPGTVDPTFVLHVGDSMPLALEVDFSRAVGTSRIFITSNAAETYNSAAPAYALPRGGGGYNLLASEVYVQATLNPRYTNDFRATKLVQIENAITGGLSSRVSEGNFRIFPGASVSGTTDVRLGSGIPPSSSIYGSYGFGGNGGDILIDGVIQNAGNVNLQVNSVSPRNILTGPSGSISGGGSITLLNAGADGGVINVRTADFAQHNIFAGSDSNPQADIGIFVDQTRGNLTINALPSTQAAMSLTASESGRQVIVNSNLDTVGSLSLAADVLNINRPISTDKGDINLTGRAVTIGSNVTAGVTGVGNLNVASSDGAITVTSAAVVKADGDTIKLTAATDISSQARLQAANLLLTAGGTITAATRTDTVTAKAGGSITLNDDDEISLTDVQTTGNGTITVTAKGLLEAVNVATGGTGSILLSTTSAGLIANDLRTKNGAIKLSAADGDIQAIGDVFVNDANPGNPSQDFELTASKGNIVMSPGATFTVADQLIFNAPLGRVLTPGTVTGVTITDPGSGYTTSPTVTFDSGSGAVVAPTVGQGQVTFVKVLNGGSGYVSAPSVVFANAGTGGSGAVATAVISGGSVVGVTISNGGIGYQAPPTISFVGGGGSGAEAQASISGLTALSVTSPGSGYQVPPTVVISAGDGAQTGTVSVDATGAITKINVAQRGSGFTAPPQVQINDASGSGFGATAVANLTGGVTAGIVSSGGSGYAGSTTATVLGGGGSGATGRPLLGLTTASISGVVSGGANYAVGDLLTVIAGTGALVQVTGVDGSGGVTGVSILSGGRDYSPGDVLYLSDESLGAAGLRLAVSTVSTGGVITGLSVNAAGTGYTTSSRLPHTGGSGGVLRVDALGFTDTVARISLFDGGQGYNLPPTVTLVGGGGSGATAVATVQGGRIRTITLTNGGSGYVTAPSVIITPAAGDTPTQTAFAFASLGNTLTLSAFRAGSGYTTRPSAVSGGSGSGAIVSFNDAQYTLVGYQPLEPGAGYSSTPTIVLSAPSGGSAAVSPVVSQVVSSITVVDPGQDYDPATTTVTLTPVAAGGGASASPISVNGVGGITSINLAAPGTGYVAVPTVRIVDRSGAGTGAVAVATTSAGITGVALTNAGSGYTSAPTVTIDGIGGQGSGATAIATISPDGYLAGITITNPGSGYSAGATVTLSGGGAASQGAATVTTSLVVTGITVTSAGAGYDPATTVITLEPVGSGATAVANLTGGTVSSIRITDNGSGYSATTPPTVTLVPFGSGALGTASVADGGVTGVTITNPGSNYAVAPKVIFAPPLGGGTAATGVATIGNVAQLNARRLSWTALEQPLDALLDQFSIAKIELTGAGPLAILRPAGDLTLEGAVTKDGNVLVQAQKLTVTGPVTAGDFNTSRTETVTLQAVGNDLVIDAPVTAPASVVLEAASGKITSTTPTSAGLVTTKDLVLDALAGIAVKTKVETVVGGATGNGAVVTITETDGITLGTPTKSLVTNNGTVNVTAGGVMAVNTVNAGTQGTINLTAGSNLVEAVPGSAAAELIAATGNLTSTSGLIDIDTEFVNLSASAPASSITIDNVGLDPLLLKNVVAANNVAISALSPLTAGSVQSNLNNVTLTTLAAPGTSAANSILVNSVTATKGVVTLLSTGDVLALDPAGKAANVTATTARVRADVKPTGTINLRTAVGTLGALANGDVTINEIPDGITLGEKTGPAPFSTVRSINGNVNVTATGAISATDVQATSATGQVTLESTGAGVLVGSVLTNKLTGIVTIKAAQSITDNDAAVDIVAQKAILTSTKGSIGALDDPLDLSVQTVIASAAGEVYVTNDGVLDLGGLNATKATITAAGPVIQTAPLTAGSLSIIGNGSPITLDTFDNALGAFGAVNAGGTVSVKDASGGLDILTTKAATFTVAAAGAVTQSGPITAGQFNISGNGTSPITLDTQSNAIDRVAVSNGSGAVAIKSIVQLDVSFIQGGAVSLSAAGKLTQSGFINATALTLGGSGTAITLDNAANKIDSLSVTNPGGTVSVRDSDGPLTLGTSTVGSLAVTVAGAVSQTGPIVADALTIAGTGAPITLDTQANKLGVFTASNGNGAVAVKDTAGPLTIGFIAGGPVSITAAGTLSQAGFINATKLAVTGDGTSPILLNTQANSIDSFTASNGNGAVAISDSVGPLSIEGITGGVITIAGTANVTQTAKIVGSSLNASSATGSVLLPNTGNNVTAFTGSAAKDVVFVNQGTFNAGPVTAGVPDGNVLLTSQTGNINVVGNLVAGNQVGLDAPLGTFTLVPPATIDAFILSYNTAIPPSFDPAAVPDIIAANGDLIVVKPGETFQFGNFTTSGTISITAGSIVVDGPLQTTGVGETIALTAQTGDVTFTKTGSARNAPSLGGLTTIAAPNGTIVGTPTTALSGGSLQLQSKNNLSLPGPLTAKSLLASTSAGTISLTNATNDFDSVSISNGNRQVTLVDVDDLSITNLTAGFTALTTGGALTQTGPISATGFVVNSTGPVTLTNPANDFAVVNIDAGTNPVSLTDKNALATSGITSGFLTLTAAGSLTQSGPIKATGFVVSNTGGATTLTNAGNDVDIIQVNAGSNSVSFTDKDDLFVSSITSGFLTLATGGDLNQSGAIKATGGVFSATAGSINLTAATNDVDVLSISNPGRTASFTDVDDVFLSTVTAGAFTLRTGGPVTQAQPMTVSSLSVTTTTGGVTLNQPGNSIGLLSANLTAAGAPLSVTNAGNLNVNQVTTQGPISIATGSGGNVLVGPVLSPPAKIQTTGAINFAGVTGNVTVANGGTITAPGGASVAAGKRIQWSLASSADTGAGSLRSILTSINSLKAPAQITVTGPSTVALGSPLPSVAVPLAVVGNGQLTLNGAGAGSTASGFVLGATTAGSSIAGVTLQNFGNSGIFIQGAGNVAVSSVTVSNSLYGVYAAGAVSGSSVVSSVFSGNTQAAYLNGAQGFRFGRAGQGNSITSAARTTSGITIVGASTGTFVQGNGISGTPTAIFISAATGVQVGGVVSGEANTISFAGTGVFATGVCTGSSVVKTAFGPAVTTRYNTGAARNLTIIQ
ncbi:MAG: beta strand repeat-containing protein [Planctomycetota bacterium]